MVSRSLLHDEVERNCHCLLTVKLVNAIIYIIILSSDDCADGHQSIELLAELQAFVARMVHLDSPAKHLELLLRLGLSQFDDVETV